MVILDEYIRSLEARIEQSKLWLKSLEDGSLIVGLRSNGDKTQDWIKREKETIATYERILAVARASTICAPGKPMSVASAHADDVASDCGKRKPLGIGSGKALLWCRRRIDRSGR